VGPEQRLERLIEVGRALVAELDLEAVLDRVLDAAQELTGARYAALGALNRERTGLERFLTRGIDDETHRAIGDLPRGRGVLGVLIEDPRPLRLAEVGEHPQSFGFPAAHPPMRSFLGVPILIRGRAFGNLYLTEKASGEFDQDDEDAVVILADWAAIAIDNARTLTAEALRRSIAAMERERARWARDLHDDTLQELAGLKLLVGSARRARDEDQRSAALDDAADRIDVAVRALRSLITDLRPAVLDEYGLEPALEALAERTTQLTGLAVALHVDLESPRLAQEVEDTLYRVVQEALTNVAKHSGATRAEVRLHERNGLVEVVVRDEGAGYSTRDETAGLGLLGMHERVALADGTMAVESEPGAGTLIRVSLPARR
jgi:signal transduction histidine kinase